MNRRAFLVALGLVAPGSLARAAQGPARVARVGVLTPTGKAPPIAAFVEGLSDLGWVEGENLAIEFRYAENDESRMPELAASLSSLPLDVVVAVGPAVFSARRAMPSVPIVATAAPDLVALKMVESLAHPGGRMTGEILFLTEYVAKRLEYLKAIAPSLNRAAVLLFRGLPLNEAIMQAAAKAAQALQISVQPMELAEVGEFRSALRIDPAAPIGGFVTTDHPLYAHNAAALASVAIGRRLPWVGAVEDAGGGALMGYGADFVAVLRHAATFTDKILRGADAGDIPIEQVSAFRTVTNLRTAAALGLTIPPTLLAAANEVIE